jgi:hypothetical protein
MRHNLLLQLDEKYVETFSDSKSRSFELRAQFQIACAKVLFLFLGHPWLCADVPSFVVAEFKPVPFTQSVSQKVFREQYYIKNLRILKDNRSKFSQNFFETFLKKTMAAKRREKLKQTLKKVIGNDRQIVLMNFVYFMYGFGKMSTFSENWIIR